MKQDHHQRYIVLTLDCTESENHVQSNLYYVCHKHRTAEKKLLSLVFTNDVVGVIMRSAEQYDLVKIKPIESEGEY